MNDTGFSCYQWTLIIDEIDYARTLSGRACPDSDCVCADCPLSKPPGRSKKDATVLKVYVKNVVTLQSFDCITQTVNCALRHVLPDIGTTTW